MHNVVIMGAGGRDFHVFNTVYRQDPAARVVAFTATQIPGIDDRTYPASLAGELYPEGIPIRPEEELEDIVASEGVQEVVFAYSDVSHETVMHAASRALALGADFRLVGPAATMLRSTRPVVAVCAVRTGCGKSQTSRYVGGLLREAGFRVAARPPSHAVRRPRADAGAALRVPGRPRRGVADHRGARGVRAARAGRHGGVRRRRLRGGAGQCRGGGRRHHLGRRQQRLPLLRARPPGDRGGPAATR